MISVSARKKIREMLAEDIGFGDITTEAVVEPDTLAKAKIVAREAGILAGTLEARAAFEEVGVQVTTAKREGEKIEHGDVVMEVSGPAHAILAAERVALNLLMRMSGVATATRNMLEHARRVNPRVIIAATRKTLLNCFDKRAVVVGGGDPHRFRLDDCALIKSDHIKLVGSIEEAIKRIRRVSFSKKIEIEVSKADDVLKAARMGVDIVMLDNVPPAEVKRAVEKLNKAGLRKKVLLEVSGGITLSSISSYAISAPDVISSSYMTFKAPTIDMNLEVFNKGFKSIASKRKQK